MEYRTRFHNIAAILEIAREPTAKTRVMMLSGLNLRQFRDYMPEMKANEVLEETKDGRLKTTAKGEKLIAKIKEVNDLFVPGKGVDESPAATAKKTKKAPAARAA